MKNEDNDFGILSVFLGIASLISSNAGGVIFGILAIIFANKQNKIQHTKFAKAGKIMGIIGIILGVIFTALAISYAVPAILANMPTA